MCRPIPHPLGQFPQEIAQWHRVVPKRILERHRQSSSLGNMVYSLGKCFTNSTGESFVPHMTCVTLRDSLISWGNFTCNPFPQFIPWYFLNVAWEFLGIPEPESFRADVHMGSLNHSFNIWKKYHKSLMISFQTLVEMSDRRVQLTPIPYRCDCLVCNAFILVVMKSPLTSSSVGGSRVKARISIWAAGAGLPVESEPDPAGISQSV